MTRAIERTRTRTSEVACSMIVINDAIIVVVAELEEEFTSAIILDYYKPITILKLESLEWPITSHH